MSDTLNQSQQNTNTPHAIDVEAALLGALLVNSEQITDVMEIVQAEAFYVPRHKLLFSAMSEITNAGEAVDTITVAARLQNKGELEQIGGKDYIADLVAQASSTLNMSSYARIIQEKFIRRKLIEAGSAITRLGLEEKEKLEQVIDSSEKELFEITHKHVKIGYSPIDKTLPKIVEEIISLTENKKRHRGIPTGFKTLDDKLSGFHPSDLVVLAARPGVGKTALALDIARRTALQHETPVGLFSLEMSSSQLTERLLAAESQLDAWRMRTGRIKENDAFHALTEAANRLSSASILIDDRVGISTVGIRSTARRMKRDHDIQLLIVDYLQLVMPFDTRRSDSMVQQVTEVSRTLKQIARELEIPVIAISQLSRDIEKRAGKPRLSDLRDSGSIEQDADVVMFLHDERRDEYEGNESAPKKIKIYIEKHRNGPTGETALLFDKKRAMFLELADDAYEGLSRDAMVEE